MSDSERPFQPVEVTPHPLPWRRGERGWLRLEAEPYEEGPGGRMVRLQVGSSIESMNRAEVAVLHRLLGDVLLAPYRLIVAGGDGVPDDRLAAIPRWFEQKRREVAGSGWRMQIVTDLVNDAQLVVAAWAVSQDVELLVQKPVDFSVGGNAVALMPCPNARDILYLARGEHALRVYRVAPDELWANPPYPTPVDVASVAHAAGGGFVSTGVDFEVVDEDAD